MSYLYTKAITPDTNTKGLINGNVFLPLNSPSESSLSLPSKDMLFYFSCKTNTFVAETDQIMSQISDGSTLEHTTKDTYPCWYSSTGNQIYCSDENMPSGNSPWTISIVVKGEYNFVSGAPVFGFGDPNTAFQGIFIELTSNTKVAAWLGKYDNAISTENAIVHTDWNHILVTYDGTTVLLYVNSKVVASRTVNMNIVHGGEYGLTLLGVKDVTTRFAGWIMGARVYGRALTPFEVDQLYQEFFKPSNNSLPTSGLVVDMSCYTNTLQAASGQLFELSDTDILHTEEEGYPCWYISNGSYLYASDIGLPSSNAPWTQSVWVKTKTYPGTETIIFAYGDLGGNGRGQAIAYVGNAVRSVGGSGNNINTTSDVVTPEEWNHIVMTYDGSSLSIYINKTLSTTQDTSRNIGIAGDYGLRIGSNSFSGWIRLVRMYNRVISAPEIEALYNEFFKVETQNKGIVLNSTLDDKAVSPSTQPIFRFTGETDTLTAETGQVFTKTSDTIVHTTNDGYPCWYIPKNQWLQASDATIALGGNSWTQCIWVKSESEDGLYNDTPFFSFGSLNTYGGGNAIGFETDTGIIGIGGNAVDINTGRNAIRPGIWNHVAITYSSNRLEVYINGEFVKYVNKNRTIVPYGDIGLGIGGCDWGSSFQGWVRGAEIYDRLLTQSEIKRMAVVTRYIKNPNNMPTKGLLLHVPLESGTTAATGQTVTKTGTVTMTEFDGIKCAYFNASSYLQVPIIPELTGNTPKAVSLWMRGSTNLTGSWIQSWAFGFGYWSSTQAFGVGQTTSSDYSDAIYATMYGGDCVVTNPNALVKMHHIVFQYDLQKTSLFIDGIKVKEINYSSANTASTKPITIGWNGSSNSKFKGYISAVRVYNRALKEDEIKLLSTEWYRVSPKKKLFIPLNEKTDNITYVHSDVLESLNEGLVFHLPLNELTVTDSLGNELSNLVTEYPTIDGIKCGHFATTSNVIFTTQTAATVLNSVTDKLSVCAWFRTPIETRAQEIVSCTEGGGFSIGLNSDNNDGYCHAYLHAGGEYANYNVFPIKGTIRRDKWYCIVMVYDGSCIKVYLNDQLMNTTTKTGTISFPSGNVGLAIGMEATVNNTISTDGFIGYISSVRIYNRVISRDEIHSLSNEWTKTEASSPSAGQVGYLINCDSVVKSSTYRKVTEDMPTDGLVLYVPLGISTSLVGPQYNSTKGTITHMSMDGIMCSRFSRSYYRWNVADPLPSGNNPFTFSVWAKPSKNVPTIPSWGWIMQQQDYDNKSSAGFIMSFNTDDPSTYKLFVAHYDENNVRYAYAITAFDERWYHLCLVYDTTCLKYYVDGILGKTLETTFSLGTYSFSIGAGHALQLKTDDFTGHISSARVYNRALSDEEVLLLSKEWVGYHPKSIFIPILKD